MSKGGFVYIMTNKNHNVLYTGVCSELIHRIRDHLERRDPNSFTSRYNIYKLVYYEFIDDIESAIKREKQLKSWTRKKKEVLINSKNPQWKDLFSEIKEW